MNEPDNRPLGVFDSGVGGLTVVQELRRILPNESIIYVGDTASVPYGTKSPETLKSYGREIISFLLEKNVKAVVLACGTTSSTIYDDLQAEFPQIPLIDVIRPGVGACLDIASKKPDLRLCLIATPATIKSGLFMRLLEKEQPGLTIYARACPLFAPMVEAGFAEFSGKPSHPVLTFAAETYLADLRGKIDALVLGCTHYPLMTDVLTHALGGIEFINLATATAHAVEKRINTSRPQAAPEILFYVSGNQADFNQLAEAILKESHPCKLFKTVRFSNSISLGGIL